jgi:hypothetical protein
MSISCTSSPYNINNLKDFNNYKNTNNQIINYNAWLACLNKNMFTDIQPNIVDTNKLIKNYNDTSTEMNNYSMDLYKKDLDYTFGKILFLIVLIITYIYCFKLIGIVQPLMQLFEKLKFGMTAVSDKINKEIPNLKNKMPEIKNDIKAATEKLTSSITSPNKMPVNKISNSKNSR